MRTMVLLCLGLVAVLVAPQDGTAQCVQCYEGYIGGDLYHQTGGFIPQDYMCEPNYCHNSNAVLGYCDTYHYKCGVSLMVEPLVKLAATLGDHSWLADLAETYPAVHFDPQRERVTLKDCEGSQIGSFAVLGRRFNAGAGPASN